MVIFSVNYPFAECKYKYFPGFVRQVQNIWISAIRILNLQAGKCPGHGNKRNQYDKADDFIHTPLLPGPCPADRLDQRRDGVETDLPNALKANEEVYEFLRPMHCQWQRKTDDPQARNSIVRPACRPAEETCHKR